MKKQWKRGMALITGLTMAVSMTPAAFADDTGPSVTSWSALYASLGVDTTTGYDAVTSATNMTGYHAKDIPSVVHKGVSESGQTVLDGIMLKGTEASVTPKLSSGTFVTSSNYGNCEFDVVPDDTVEGYVWNEYETNLYAVTISNGETTVGAVPWVDYYVEPATSGPHYNKVQVAISNGIAKASNKANVNRYAAFVDENNCFKAGNYTVTLYSEGYEPLTAEIEVPDTQKVYMGTVTAGTIASTDTSVTLTGLPKDLENASATVKYTAGRGATAVTEIFAEDAAVENGKIQLSKALEEYAGKNLSITVSSSNYTALSASCSVLSLKDWKSVYDDLGVDTTTGYDAVTSATNMTGYHAKDIPSVVHKGVSESGQTVLDGIMLKGTEASVTPELSSAYYSYTSSYGIGEFDVVPDDTVEGYVWNEYETNLYAVTISNGETTVGAVPWVDYYVEPATSGPHYNKVQVAINNGTSTGKNAAEVTRYASFFDDNNHLKAGTYTVTLYSEGYKPLSAEIEVLPTYEKEISAGEVTTESTSIELKNLPSDISGATASVSYSYTKEGERRPTTVDLAENVSVEKSQIKLQSELTDYEGKELKIVVNSENYAPMETTLTVKAAETDTPEKVFEDVPDDSYFADAVYWAVEKGITKGTDEKTFSPEKSCTRAEAVTFLYRAAGSPETSGGIDFTDVDSSSYYANAVAWAVEKGITKGVSESSFAPDEICTRAQIATFLYRFAGEESVVAGDTFEDVPADAYYASAVQWAEQNNVTNGIEEHLFGPEEECTRAQIVTFLYRYMK